MKYTLRTGSTSNIRTLVCILCCWKFILHLFIGHIKHPNMLDQIEFSVTFWYKIIKIQNPADIKLQVIWLGGVPSLGEWLHFGNEHRRFFLKMSENLSTVHLYGNSNQRLIMLDFELLNIRLHFTGNNNNYGKEQLVMSLIHHNHNIHQFSYDAQCVH